MPRAITPLIADILLHYECRGVDYRKGDFTAPAVGAAVASLLQLGLLESPGGYGNLYGLTPAGRDYVNRMLSIPLGIDPIECRMDISLIDAESAARFFEKNAGALIAAINKAVRFGHHLQL